MIDLVEDSSYTNPLSQLAVKQCQVSQHKIIYLHRLVGVLCTTLNIKTESQSFFCKKKIKHVSNHLQIEHVIFTNVVRLQVFLNQCLSILFNIPLMVTIHGRENILVWVVVNCKIPLVETFYNKEQALALVSILHEYEKKHFKKNITHTIYVQRDTDRLTGIIPRSDK